MNERPVCDSWYSAPSAWNALDSPENSDRWVCMPEPGRPASGRGMNEAWWPWAKATSLTTVRKVMMLSAVDSASA